MREIYEGETANGKERMRMKQQKPHEVKTKNVRKLARKNENKQNEQIR